MPRHFAIRSSRSAAAGSDDGRDALETKPFQNLTVRRVSRADLYKSTRRSVYLPVLRSALYDQFQAFDFPDPAVSSGDRPLTTVASQALFMMNGPLMRSCPERLADLLLSEPSATDSDRMQDASLRVLGRPAADDELAEWASFLDRYQAAVSAGEDPASRRRLAWQGFCRALLSSNEFIYMN